MRRLNHRVRPRSPARHPIFPGFHPQPGNSPPLPVCYGPVVMRIDFENAAAAVDIVVIYDPVSAGKYAKECCARLPWLPGRACEWHLNPWNVAVLRSSQCPGQIDTNRRGIRTILRGFYPNLSADIQFSLLIMSHARLSALRKAMLSLSFDLPGRRRQWANPPCGIHR